MDTDSNLAGLIAQSGFFLFHSWGLVLNVATLLFLTAITALISGAEIALFSIAQGFRTQAADHLKGRFKIVHKWIQNPDYLRASLKISGGCFKIALIVLLVGNILNLPFQQNNQLFVHILILICISVFYVILIEVFPKSYASAEPEKLSVLAIYLLVFIFFLFSPVNKIAYNLNNWINNRFNKKTGTGEMSSAMGNTSDAFSDEEEIVRGIVKFGNIDVSQILRPRVDVVAVDNSNSLKEILEVVVESGYSRIPVYNGNFDNVKGILYVKDLLPYIHSDDKFIWQSLIRPPYFVPESKKVKELLNEFKANKIHMAVIVDEYGGTLGIVTLEDILEEIVGDISDESDEDEKFYSKINENTFIFDAKVLLNDFYKIVQSGSDIFESVKGDADTLAGLILELKGEIPLRNEELSYKNFVFKMESVDSRRIKQIRVTILNGNNTDDLGL